MTERLENDVPTQPAPPADALAGPDGIGHGRAQAHDRNAGADILAKPNGFLPENMRDQTEIVAIDDGPPRVSTPKESWVEIHPLCPKCVNKPMSRHEKKWKCKWCDETDTNGKWCVEFYPTSLTLNKRQKPRLNQLTLETWKDEDEAKRRAGDLLIHFRGIQEFPQQRTSQTVPQCRAAEALYRVLKQRSIPDDAALKAVGQFFQSSSIEELRFASHLLFAIRDSGLKPPEDLITFLAAYKECGIPCSLLGMMGYCKSTKWRGDLLGRPTFVEAVQKVMKHKTSSFVGGGRALGPEGAIKAKSLNAYIMAYFQPDYPNPVYPEVFTDRAIIEFVTYSYDTPRPGMPPTEIEKWRAVCAEARKAGRPLPEKPVEHKIYKLVEDGVDENDTVKYKKVPGTLEYPRPWPRSVMNGFIIQCKSLKNAMARKTLCLEPAAWIEPPGPDLKPFPGTREELAAEAKARARVRRVLTTVEKQRILNASLEIDGGCGSASVLWQGWGGGRRADVEKYCKDTFRKIEGRIKVERWQNKNQSCKDVTPMMNFYLMADFIEQCGLLTDDFLKNGFKPLTRIRILIRAGFWEDSWGKVVSTADSMAGSDFGYQPFEDADILDLTSLMKRLRAPSLHPALAILWDKFTDEERQRLSEFRTVPDAVEMTYSPSEVTKNQVKGSIIARLNEIMDGPNFHTPERFAGISLRRRTEELLRREPTGPNLKYLNRLMLEDLCPAELARRQAYPPNGLRRSGMSAIYQVFEDRNHTIEYFSTGAESWEKSYKSSYTKQAAREHLQLLYRVMDSEYSDKERESFLPKGHKLVDFRTPAIIAAEGKNKALAENFRKTAPRSVRKPFYNKKKTKYSPEDKAKFVSAFRTSGMTQRTFAGKHNLVFGVFHKWLDAAGATTKARSEAETAAIIEQFKARPGQMTKEEFANSVGIPFRTLWAMLKKSGLTTEMVKHTPEEITRHIETFKNSGMTRTKYAKSIHVDRTTFLGWLEASGVFVDGRDMTAQREKEIALILEEFGASGMSQDGFAKSKGISSRTLCGWLQRVKTRPSGSKQMSCA